MILGPGYIRGPQFETFLGRPRTLKPGPSNTGCVCRKVVPLEDGRADKVSRIRVGGFSSLSLSCVYASPSE